MTSIFDLQGHRGARGLRPENTLPGFEAALDVGVTTVETDLHLTRDGIVVLCHDAYRSERLFQTVEPAVPVCQLALMELQRFPADRNPDQGRFPKQDARVTPVAARFAFERGMLPHAVPRLEDLFAFAADYAGDLGKAAGKTDWQRQKAARLRFDLELKRVPFFPEAINDGFDGRQPASLERQLVQAVRAAEVAGRTTVRSFDHRCVGYLLQLEPGLTGAVLVAETAPANPAELARAVGASVYCPSYQFLDRDLVRRAQERGVRVVPWTVNEPEHWRRLLDWGVDGITTDFPDRLAAELMQRGLAF